MADANIQSITFPVSYQGTSITYVANINKQTGAMDVYEATPLGNRYFILTSYPGNNWKPELGPATLIPGNYDADQKKFILTTVSEAANNQRAAYINKNFTQDQKNNLFSGVPKVQNTAPPDPNAGSGGTSQGSTSPIDTLGTPTTLNLGVPESSNFFKSIKGQDIRYPKDIGGNGQDYIKFDLVSYGTRTFSSTPGSILQGGLSTRTNTKELQASVILPIQPTINDQNGVNWGEEQMNALQLVGAALARNPNQIPDVVKGFGSITDNPAYQELILKYVAGQAVGINPLARTDGLILNPNLELLFNGPTLRPFTFTFRLSPRNDKETVTVKTIIRFFKEGSVVRTTNTGLFLKSPNVFDISYNGIGANGLNKIKTCALRNVSVNYTPEGSYMTFENGTMTSYELSLQFSELEPIYDTDYNAVADHPIGY